MAVRFATATGNWSNTAIWDGGTLPLSDDTVHPNGFTVTIDQDITIASLNNNISPVYLPGMPIPKMTGNTQPSGTVNAGSDASNAWKAFDQTALLTLWAGTGVAAVNSTAWLSYQFPVGQSKIIKRYYFYRASYTDRPSSWIFQGSNDGSSWTDLETVTSNTATTPYLSGVLPNTTAYLYYRIIVTAVPSGTSAALYNFEMTESTATTYGVTTGGLFTVPASLSGTRNIVQSGAGIISNNAATVMTLAHTSGNTVNFNVTSGGFIVNPFYRTTTMINPVINITGTAAVNFNSNLWGCQTPNNTYSQGGVVGINGAATITVNGSIYADKGSDGAASFTAPVLLMNIVNCVVNINGIVNASDYKVFGYPIISTAVNTLNVTGNVIGNISSAIYSTIGSFINLTGTATVTNSNSQAAINMTSAASLLTINGSITNVSNVNAIVANRIRFASTATPYWIYQTNGASDITLAYGAALGAYPVEADVRFGTTYAASPTRIGTLRVPLPQYVSQGVLTDNTVGTAYINAADVWNVLTSNITTSGSIGERLKTASTVQTNGDQLAAYIV